VRPPPVRREITLGLAVYALYLLVGRIVLRRDGRARARRNAHRVVALERRFRLDVEPDVGYGLFNVTLTVGGLVLLYRRGDERYLRFRRACMLAYLGAQPVFLLFPTAPPRVLDGFVDTLSEVSGLDLEHPFLLRFYNPVAAMPSLHVAFALVTGAEIAERAGSLPVKTLARAYAPLVTLVVAGTGNHYVLDAVAGAALGAAARSTTS
jgi:hypothetical protein